MQWENNRDANRPPSDLALLDLVASERRYRALFERTPDGILLLDVNTGRIIEANPFMSLLTGYSREMLLGKELWQLGWFTDRQVSLEAFRQLRREGYLRYENLPLRARNGERRDVEVVGITYQENGLTVIQCNIREIAARKRIERAAAVALNRERRIADAFQDSLLTEIVQETLPGFEAAVLYEPALMEASVGGDFYDALEFPEARRTCLMVGDVTGKGLHAAILAGRTKDVLRAFLREDPEPSSALTRLNVYLCDPVSRCGNSQRSDTSPLYVSLTLIVSDPQTGVTRIASAGAEPAAILRASGSTEIVKAEGLLLGIKPGTQYTSQRLQLYDGDIVLMVTDGITEARRNLPRQDDEIKDKDTSDSSHMPDLLGYERLLTIAHRHCASLSIVEMTKGILEEARAFGGYFRDDVCLLLARRRQCES